MTKISLFDLLQQDIQDLESLVKYKEYGLNEKTMKKQARGIILNLKEHLEDLIQKG